MPKRKKIWKGRKNTLAETKIDEDAAMVPPLGETDYYAVPFTCEKIDVVTTLVYFKRAASDPLGAIPTDSLGTGSATGRHKTRESTGVLSETYGSLCYVHKATRSVGS